MNEILEKKVINTNKLKSYSYDEVLKSSLEYFKNDKLAAEVWINKYCLKDTDDDNILYYELNPDEMHHRLAKELSRIEKNYPNPLSESEIYNRLKHFKKLVPQGSPMTGIGNDMQKATSLSNCFVVDGDNSDSYGGIFKIDQNIAQLQKRRAGVGSDLSFIRPTGSKVNNSALTSTGVVPFMRRYSNTTKEVAQDGRRGALMLSIASKHPDVEKFIDAKMTKGEVTGANVSVKLDDEFMNAALNNDKYIQQYPVDSKTPLYKTEIDANKIWKKIIHNAWKSAEPGVLYWDKVINESIPDMYGKTWKTTSTNPCGEIPLCPYDSCRLLAINLFGYVKNPFTVDSYFDYEEFKADVIIAQRLMDDIVDLELEKIDNILSKIHSDPENDEIKRTEIKLWEEIRKKAYEGRRTGLGITGEGDMLAALGYRYGSEDGNDFSESIHKIIKLDAYRSSVIMAKERGAFPIYDSQIEMGNPFIKRLSIEDPTLYAEMLKYGRRNIALLTIAPTGTVSLMTQTTSGIEPVFLPVYKRRRKINPQEKNVKVDFTDDEGQEWVEYNVFHHNFKLWLDVNGYNVSEVENYSSEEIDELIKLSPYYKATSNDLDWVSKVELQGRVQQHIDHSISVTINLPKDATEEIVEKVYEKGWRSGCKGLTIYRDGSRDGVMISDDEKKNEVIINAFKDNHAPKRPKRIDGVILRFRNNNEEWIAVIGIIEGRPYEVFTGKLENGLSKLPKSVDMCTIVRNIIEEGNGDKFKRYDLEYLDENDEKVILEGVSHIFNPEFWNYAKLVSGLLRHGMPVEYTYSLIESLTFKEDHLFTWKRGVLRALKKFISNGKKAKGKCPECGTENTLVYKEGCLTCLSCGYGKCG